MQEAHPAVPRREARGFEVHAHGLDALEHLRDASEVGGVRDECVACKVLFHEEILARRCDESRRVIGVT